MTCNSFRSVVNRTVCQSFNPQAICACRKGVNKTKTLKRLKYQFKLNRLTLSNLAIVHVYEATHDVIRCLASAYFKNLARYFNRQLGMFHCVCDSNALSTHTISTIIVTMVTPGHFMRNIIGMRVNYNNEQLRQKGQQPRAEKVKEPIKAE